MPAYEDNLRTNTDARASGINTGDLVATITDGPLQGLSVGLTQDGQNLLERASAKREGRALPPEHWTYWASHPMDTRLQLGGTRTDTESGKEIGYGSRAEAEDALLEALEKKMRQIQSNI